MITRIFGFCLLVMIFVTVGCGNDGVNKTGVTVTNLSGETLPGVTVVIGDRNGAMKASGSTDANGAITFSDTPLNATVTAALSCLRSGATSTTYSLDVRYDVNGRVTLKLDDCSGASSDVLGTVTVNITNTIAGIAQNEIISTYPFLPTSPFLVTQQTLTIRSYDLQEDGKLSIYVIGKDTNGVSLGYGMLLDQTFTNGMTMNISVDKPMSFMQYQLTNLPLSMNGLCADISQIRTGKSEMSVDNCSSLSSSSSTMTVNVPYIPGFGDQFYYSADAFSSQSNDNALIMSYQYLGRGPSASLSGQSFDFSQALKPPSGLSITGAATVTPALVWSGLEAADATSNSLFASFRIVSGSYWYLIIDDLSLTRTSITFPELPDSLAAFRPTGVTSFSIYTRDINSQLYRSSGSSYMYWPTFASPLDKSASHGLQNLQRYGRLRHQQPPSMSFFKHANILKQY